MRHYQNGADSCACGEVWPCTRRGRGPDKKPRRRKSPPASPPAEPISALAVETVVMPTCETIPREILFQLMNRIKEDGRSVGFIILGWRTFFQLGWELKRRGLSPMRVKEFHGISIVVDDAQADRIFIAPKVDDVQPHFRLAPLYKWPRKAGTPW